MADTNIKIPNKHYVGMVLRHGATVPLGFITPWGEDAASTKRMATVDSWVKQQRRDKPLPTLTINNTPMSGFKLTTDIRSSSYGGSDKWRIEDPRGFELEISSDNLGELLAVGMIDRGEIADSCVWARSGSQNVLLSTSTDVYKDAVKNTQVAAMSASWKDAKVGNTVLLQNNIAGVWLGRMHGVWFEKYNSDDNHTSNKLRPTSKTVHVFYVKESGKKHKLLLITTPKLASITDSTEMSNADAELLVNRLIADNTCSVDSNGYNTYVAMALNKINIDNDIALSLRPIVVNSEEELSKLTGYQSDQYVYTLIGGLLYRIGSKQTYGAGTGLFPGYEYSKNLFDQNKIVPVGNTVSHKSYWNQTANHWAQSSIDFNFHPSMQFYSAILSFETKAGTKIEAILK